MHVTHQKKKSKSLLSINRTAIENAWRMQDRHQFIWWDSLILSAAQIQDCKLILNEDLQHEQAIDELRWFTDKEIHDDSCNCQT